MRLKRLEIVGFKSFANRVSLEFGHGITAIVGPNGSGKSNISDAIKWVLGEQSIKSLRGSKLEDVIFSGSGGKRPLGMAEVQLTLDNTDGFFPIEYNEITVVRRVYRSGDSEFLINRNPCRLRDIQDLFTDTGLGKEGYAIVGQGQIDAILNANPYERRLILEEAAGIVKYRQRKEQAQKKMTQTEYDLVRISDILNELNQQLIPLEAEAKKARLYQDLAGRLESAELDLMSIKINKLADKKKHLEEIIEQCNLEGSQLHDKYSLYEENINNDQTQLASIDQKIEDQQNEIIALNEEINHKMQAIGVIEERLSYSRVQQEEKTKQANSYHKRDEELTAHLASIKEELNEHQTQCEHAQAELTDCERELTNLRLSFQEQRQKLEAKKNEFIEFVRKLADARNFNRNYQQQKSVLVQQVKYAETEHNQLNTELKQIHTAIDLQKKKIINLDRQQSEYETRLKELTAKYTGVDHQVNELEEQEKQTIEQYRQQNSRLKALQDLEENYDGYNYSVRKLMQESIPGVEILGTIADVITVPEGLELAIEAALGSGLQYMITPSNKEAKLAIEWLKKNRAGRGTFLPLNSIKGSSFPNNFQKYWKIEKCLGPAVDLLQFDNKYLPAISALLGRIAVAEDLDTAIILQRKIPSFNRIVTLAGEIVMPNGSLTGGSFSSKSSGFLARKNEISKLEKQRIDLEQAIKEITAEKKEVTELLDRLNQQLDAVRRLELQAKYEKQTLESEYTKLKTESKRIEQLLRTKKQQLLDYEHLINELQDESAASAETILQLENEEIFNRAQIDKLETVIKALEKQISEENELLTQKKVTLTGLVSKNHQLTELHSEMNVQLIANKELLEKNKTQLNQIEQQRIQLQSELISNQEQQEIFKQEKAHTVKLLAQSKETKTRLQESISQISSDMKVLQKSLNKIDKKAYNYRLELDRILLEVRRIEEDLLERDVKKEDIQTRTVSRSMTILNRETKTLKQQIRNLGIVNLGALHEYETVKDRVFFLKTQFNDLEEAKRNLNELIDEIDTTSAELLLSTVKELKREFQIMFAKLFSGGTASIELTDPDNILESGVNIIAQPPGKTPQHLSLLSGGERALTAIALWFAICRIKPTPFCVLDEIDASLDETNLERFAKQMEDISKSMQLLIITHRQGTMEVAHRLYGVTMGDNAVSQLISVKLS